MKRAIAFWVIAVALPIGSAFSQPSGGNGDLKHEWTLLGGNAEAQHYSPLSQINRSNIGRLRLAWYADMPTRDGLLGNALVADGVVFQSGAFSKVWANDLRSGKLLWEFDPMVKFNGTMPVSWGARVNRGLAIWRNLAIVATADCRLVAIDRHSGQLVWQAKNCEPQNLQTITGAPRVGGDKVFIGDTNMELGVGRGHLDAFDAKTGRRVWRFYTMPGDPAKGFESKSLEMAAKTWGKEWWKKTSGVNVWEAITYDPELRLVYFGSGCAQPQNRLERGENHGAELFSCSIIAANADTGEYVWHYQVTPNDAWGYDATMHLMIAELPIGGIPRRVVMSAPKNGFFYVLDARTGKLLSANNIVPVNWASHIDLKSGRPVETPDARYFDHPGEWITVRPGGWGAHSWQAMSYSSRTGLIYIPAIDLPMLAKQMTETGPIGGDVRLDWTTPLRDPSFVGKAGRLIAWDPVAQSARWTVDLPFPTNGGVLATAGDLVFQGTAEGNFRAYDARTGKRLWSIATGSAVQAAPSAVEVDSKQLILLPVGIGGGAPLVVRDFVGDQGSGPPRLLAFVLDGEAKMPLRPADQTFGKPPRPRPASEGLVRRGRELFDIKGCYECHGVDAVRYAGSSSVPDLRKSSAETLDQFAAIVIGGLRTSKGMPMFAGQVNPDELQALQAFILDQAWNAYERHQLN